MHLVFLVQSSRWPISFFIKHDLRFILAPQTWSPHSRHSVWTRCNRWLGAVKPFGKAPCLCGIGFIGGASQGSSDVGSLKSRHVLFLNCSAFCCIKLFFLKRLLSDYIYVSVCSCIPGYFQKFCNTNLWMHKRKIIPCHLSRCTFEPRLPLARHETELWLPSFTRGSKISLRIIWPSKRTSWNLHVDCWEAFQWQNLEETNSTRIEERTSFRSFYVSSLESLRSSKLVHLQFVSSLKHQINHSLIMAPGGIPMAFSHKNPSMSDFIRTALTGTAVVQLSLESFWDIVWRLSFHMILYMNMYMQIKRLPYRIYRYIRYMI